MDARRMLVAMAVLAAGCAAQSDTPGSAPGDIFRFAQKKLATTPYDAPGTVPGRLSPEVVKALVATASADAAPGTGPPEPGAPARHLRRERLERALPHAQTAYDRSWLALELGKLQAESGDCAAALATLAALERPEATAVERVQGRAEAGRIRAGVCWSTAKWEGYRLRPLPDYPRRGAQALSGTVDLVLGVNAAGSVVDAAVVRGDYRVLELAALRAAQNWRYQPLLVDGRAIPFTVRQRLLFQAPVVLLQD